MPYDLYPAVDQNYDFAPEVRVALHKSIELRNTVDPMTTVLRNNLQASEKWDGRVIANTDTDRLERYDAGTSQWYALTESGDVSGKYVGLTGNETIAGVKTFSSSPVMPGNATTALQAIPKQQLDALLAALIPTGTIVVWGGASAPSGWQLCNGTLLRRDEQRALFEVIGVAYGIGDGVTTFASPNLQGRVVVCAGAGYGLNGSGGEASHILSMAEMPYHDHGVRYRDGGAVGLDGGSGGYLCNYGAGHNVPSFIAEGKGGGAAHNVMQPYLVLNYIIKL